VRGISYKLWNRMSAGSYMPAPVRAVEIPKDHGTGVRVLGVPTVADRVAQTAAAMLLEERLEPIFHPDSFGYRPGRSAHDALAVSRRRCWTQAWVLDLDIRRFFDSVTHDLLLKAVAHHTRERWVLLYIERWLKAPMQMPDGTIVVRERGTPQGSPISPLLANVFMTYAFDLWMTREHSGIAFERYADDSVPRTLKEDRCRRRYRRMRCCMRDGGWPSAVALQGEIANHREVRRSRAGVLSVAEKARRRARQVWVTKASESEPPLKCRKRIDDIQTGVESLPRDESGGSLLTGQVGVRHGWWRERGLGSGAELGNLSLR
jgi:Reverse transcriptase (RNA-dependent DNA polymerase)